MKPRRVRRKRAKGWRMPAGAVYVGRPTKWGNPFQKSDHFGPYTIVGLFTDYITGQLRCYQEAPKLADQARAELRGKDLACWCPLDAPCHADVLLKIANEP